MIGLFWKYPFGSFQKNGQNKRKKNHLGVHFREQTRHGFLHCFPSHLFLPFYPFLGTEVQRRVGNGKGEGAGEAQLLKESNCPSSADKESS